MTVNRTLSSDRQALAEEHEIQPVVHDKTDGFSDRFALGFTKLLRFIADAFFAERYGYRAIVLATVAAVPAMVGAMFTRLTSLRQMKDDQGWIRTLMEEAENERMRLMMVSSVAARSGHINFDDMNAQKDYLPMPVGSQLKLACLMFARERVPAQQGRRLGCHQHRRAP